MLKVAGLQKASEVVTISEDPSPAKPPPKKRFLPSVGKSRDQAWYKCKEGFEGVKLGKSPIFKRKRTLIDNTCNHTG